MLSRQISFQFDGGPDAGALHFVLGADRVRNTVRGGLYGSINGHLGVTVCVCYCACVCFLLRGKGPRVSVL